MSKINLNDNYQHWNNYLIHCWLKILLLKRVIIPLKNVLYFLFQNATQWQIKKTTIVEWVSTTIFLLYSNHCTTKKFDVKQTKRMNRSLFAFKRYIFFCINWYNKCIKTRKKNILKMTDEQHSIEKLNSFLFIRERKTSRDHYTSDMMFSSFCFFVLYCN